MASDSVALKTRVILEIQSSKQTSLTLARTLLEMKFLVTEIFLSGENQSGGAPLIISRHWKPLTKAESSLFSHSQLDRPKNPVGASAVCSQAACCICDMKCDWAMRKSITVSCSLAYNQRNKNRCKGE